MSRRRPRLATAIKLSSHVSGLDAFEEISSRGSNPRSDLLGVNQNLSFGGGGGIFVVQHGEVFQKQSAGRLFERGS